MGPTSIFDGCGKSGPPQGFDPTTVHSVASRYTDYAIPAHNNFSNSYIIGSNIENFLNCGPQAVYSVPSMFKIAVKLSDCSVRCI
jgi:hypothetical protein